MFSAETAERLPSARYAGQSSAASGEAIRQMPMRPGCRETFIGLGLPHARGYSREMQTPALPLASFFHKLFTLCVYAYLWYYSGWRWRWKAPKPNWRMGIGLIKNQCAPPCPRRIRIGHAMRLIILCFTDWRRTISDLRPPPLRSNCCAAYIWISSVYRRRPRWWMPFLPTRPMRLMKRLSMTF